MSSMSSSPRLQPLSDPLPLQLLPGKLEIDQHGAVFQEWKNLNSAAAINLSLNFLEHLKDSYPDHHAIQTSTRKFDFVGYAKAGYAEAFRDETEANLTIRAAESSGSRLANKPKTVVDEINFGRWKYDGSRRNILSIECVAIELHDEIYVFDNQRWSKDKELYDSVKDSSWDEVILNQTMKKNLIADVQGFFDNQALYKKLAVPWKRGIILHGVPGNGKTLSIKALINTFSCCPAPIPSLYVKSFDGLGQKCTIKSVFQKAREMAPCLLIFEDLDSLITHMTRSYFLNEADGLESNEGILMIGSTNHLERLDPAISRRPSRFDRKYAFRVPNEEERCEYARFWRGKLGDGESEMVDFADEICGLVAKVTEGFSFAYLKELFVVTLLGIAREASSAGANEDVVESGMSTDDEVVVEKEDTVDGLSEQPQPASGSTKSNGAAKQPEEHKVHPKVDIPEHLKDNIFLKALIAQAKMLMDEMDNTDESGREVSEPPRRKMRM